MSRLPVRVLAAAALTTAAFVALPQAAFASQAGPESGGSVSIGAVVGTQATSAAAPREATSKPAHTAPDATARATARTSSATTAPAKPSSSPKASPARTTTPATGADISYPQCSVTPPANQLFGVIGVNGGTAKDFNSCLGTEFAWASTTIGSTPQGTGSLYINTANPGSQSSWWPVSDTDRPTADPSVPGPRSPLETTPVTYPNGDTVGCSKTTDPYGPACSYVYGYVRAEQAVQYAKEQLGSAYSGTVRWWLDVETSNTWAGPVNANAASLAGAATSLARSASDGVARVGVYSSTAQYRAITGGTGSAVPALPNTQASPLIGLPEWGAGASNLKGAQSNCGVTPFTGGAITLTQFVSGSLDYDVSCRGY